jgi:ceramide glucosyltransferase
MAAFHSLIGTIGITSLAFAAIYALLALVAVLVWRRRTHTGPAIRLPAVTVLEPLCGAEPGLYENLRSFCRQDYPKFQIVFGIGEANDPALEVAARLQAEFPALPIDVIVDPQQHGHNRKISSLINMLQFARHDTLVMEHSDVLVGPDYLTLHDLPGAAAILASTPTGSCAS